MFKKHGKIAEVIDNIKIDTLSDALDLMATARYNGFDGIIVSKEMLHEDFFELKTRLAGEILQKFSTYGMKLAIIGDFKNIQSKSLRDFIYESNMGCRVVWVEDKVEALKLIG